MKRFLKLRWIYALVALSLVGCSLPFGNSAAPVAPLEVLSSDASTRRIKHALGETDAPLAPQRVLALGEEELLLNMLALGMKPVASNVNVPDRIALTNSEELAGITLFPSSANVTLESLTEFAPDLIVGTRFFVEAAGYDNLSAIAPTVALSGNDAMQLYLDTALLVGVDTAQADVDAFRQRVQAEAQALRSANKSISFATIYPAASVAVWVDGPTPIPALARDLGVTFVPDQQAVEQLGPRNGRAFISLEQLNLLAGDSIILLQSDAVEGETESMNDIMARPLWQALPAVPPGRVFILDRLGYPGFRGQQRLLDDLVTIIRQ